MRFVELALSVIATLASRTVGSTGPIALAMVRNRYGAAGISVARVVRQQSMRRQVVIHTALPVIGASGAISHDGGNVRMDGGYVPAIGNKR